jgi:hypothetical protein
LASEPYSPLGIALRLIGKDDDLRAWAQAQHKTAQAAIQTAIPVTPGFEESWTRMIGEGAGSLPVSIGAAAAGGLPGIAALGASAGYGATSANVLEMTGDPEAARKWGLVSAAVGGISEPASAALPTLRIIDRIDRASGGAFFDAIEKTAKKQALRRSGQIGARDITEGAAKEFITEAIQEMPDEAARQVYDEERTLLEGIVAVARAGAAGGIVGAFVPALLVRGYQAKQKLTGKSETVEPILAPVEPQAEPILAPDDTPPIITPGAQSESFVGPPDDLAPQSQGETPALVGETPAVVGETPALVGETPAVLGETEKAAPPVRLAYEERSGFLRPQAPLGTPHEPPATGTPVTVTVWRGSGREERGAVYAPGVTRPVMGDGLYYAFSPIQAARFGPNLEKSVITLKNPLFIRSHDDLLRLGLEAVPSTIQEMAGLADLIQRRIVAGGHDGVIVEVPRATWGDASQTGSSAKRLRDVFDVSQVFIPKSEAQPAVGRSAQGQPGKAVRIGEKVKYGNKIVANVLEIHPETGLVTIGWFDEQGGHGIDVPTSELRSESGHPISIAVDQGSETAVPTIAPATTPEIVAETPQGEEQASGLAQVTQEATERSQRDLRPIQDVPGSDADLGSGAMGIVAPPAAKHAILAVDTIAKAIKHGYSTVKALARTWGRAGGDFPTPLFRANLERVAARKAIMKEFRFGIDTLTRLAKKLNESELALVNQAFQEKSALARLGKVDPALHAEVVAVRQKLDQLSDLLIKSGAASEAVIPIIAANRGTYLLRSFQAFDDPRWSEKVSPAVRNRYLYQLARENPGYHPRELEGLAEAVLKEAREAELPVNIFAKRHASPALRAFLGEYKHPIINATRSAARMAQVITRHEYFRRLRAEGWGKWFHPRAIVIPEGQPYAGKYIAEIAGTDENWMRAIGTDPTTGERTAVFTTPEIAAAMREALNPKEAGWLLRTYMKAVAFSQFAKAVISPAAIIRDAIGNAIFFVSQGHWQAWKFADAARATFANMLERGDPAVRQYVQKLTRLGVFGDASRANEFRAVVEESLKGGLDDTLGGSIERMYKAGTRGFAHAKEGVDNFYRAASFEIEKAAYAKAYPALSADAVEKIAADRVRRAYPTWSLLPRAVTAIRRFPLIGDFISFSASVPLIFLNTLDMIQQDMRTPATRAIGVRRLIGLSVGLGTFEAIATGLRYLFGVTRDEDEAIRRMLPHWSKNSTIAHFGADKDGDPVYTDLGQVDPWQYLKKPLRAFMRGDDFREDLVAAMVEAFRPYAQTRMLTRAILEVTANKKSTGGQVYNPQAPVRDQLVDVITHLSRPLSPGIVDTTKRIARGARGEQTIYGEKFTWQNEVVALASRMKKLNRAQAFDFKMRQLARAIDEAEGQVASKGAQPGTVTEQELETVYLTMNQSRRALMQEAHKDAVAIMTLGLPRSKVVQLLKAEGFSRADIMAIMSGNVPAWIPSAKIMSRIEARVRATGGDPAEIIRRRQTLRRTASRERREEALSRVGG